MQYINLQLFRMSDIALYTLRNIWIIQKNSGQTSIPGEQPNQNNEMKIADSVLSSLFMRNNGKCKISHAP